MIMLGAWTGIRLSDAASLTWGQIDLDEGRLAYIPAKRSRKLHRNLEVALHSEAVKFLRKAEQGIGKAPVFPTLNGRRSGSGGANAGGLSNEFGRLIDRAGIKNQLLRKGRGKGRDVWEKSFHSLRHTMISRMTQAEVSKDVRKAIAGHSTDSAHERYTHLSFDKQKTTISRLPSLVR
jgi:integrase